MDNKILINYMKWADLKIFDVLTTVMEESSDKYDQILAVLLHLTEEYRAWLCDIKQIDVTSWLTKYKNMRIKDLLGECRELHEEWLDYCKKPNKVSYEIDEGEFAVSIELDEVIFNLVNHSSYHRGQIVKFLRFMDIEVPITDFYWYKISQLDI